MTINNQALSVILLSLNETRAALGNRSRATIYRDIQNDRIPKPVYLGGRPYWKSTDIEELIENLTFDPQQRGQKND